MDGDMDNGTNDAEEEGETEHVSGLTKGKTYYVKVRAYKTDSTGQAVYGKYSAVKKVKIKK